MWLEYGFDLDFGLRLCRGLSWSIKLWLILHAECDQNCNVAFWYNLQQNCKGKLDDRQVAIKVKGPLRLWSFEKTIDFVLNQVAIKQLISNNNVLRLYGCCLEIEIPILVFELISNNTLFDNLHGKGKWVPLDLMAWPCENCHGDILCYLLHALWQVKTNSTFG